MSRYVKDFLIVAPPEQLFNAVQTYLSTEGYGYTQFRGENVFKKGTGWLSAPTFIKISFSGNVLRLEAWLKTALLPGVYVGETGITGFWGWAVKGVLRNRVNWIESVLMQYGSVPAMAAPYYQQVPQAQPYGQVPQAQPYQQAPQAQPYPQAPQAQPVQQSEQPQEAAQPAQTVCPRCGAALDPSAKFCNNCGQPLQDPPQPQA